MQIIKKSTNIPTINKTSTMIKNKSIIIMNAKKTNNLIHMNHQQRNKNKKSISKY